MKRFISFALLLCLVLVSCSTTDYEINPPYGEKSKRDLEIAGYVDLGNGAGNYNIFGPAGGFKKDEYKEMGWRLYNETKPRGFVSADQDGFVMDLKDIQDDAVIIWNGFGYYRYKDDDYGYPLNWQDFREFAERSEYRVVLAKIGPTGEITPGDTTVAIRLRQGRIYRVDTTWHNLYAYFKLNKNFAYVNEEVLFDGSGSSGRYILPIQTHIIAWDWYVDGVWVGRGERFTYKFLTEGTHEIKLIVTDNEGNYAEMITTIQILQGNQTLPWDQYGVSRGDVYFGYALVEINGQTKLRIWGHRALLRGRADKPYFFGRFNGQRDVAWQWIIPKDDPNNVGWMSIVVDLPIPRQDMDIYLGWGGFYLENASDPFSQTNFDHMPYCYGWGCGPDGENGPDDQDKKDIYIKIRALNGTYIIEDPCK